MMEPIEEQRLRRLFAEVFPDPSAGRDEPPSGGHLELTADELRELLAEPHMYECWADHFASCRRCAGLLARAIGPIELSSDGPPPAVWLGLRLQRQTRLIEHVDGRMRAVQRLGKLAAAVAATLFVGLVIGRLAGPAPPVTADAIPNDVRRLGHALQIRNRNGTVVESIAVEERLGRAQLGPSAVADLSGDGLREIALALDNPLIEGSSELRIYRRPMTNAELSLQRRLALGRPDLAWGDHRFADIFGTQHLLVLELDGDPHTSELLALIRHNPFWPARAIGLTHDGVSVVDLWNEGELRTASSVQSGDHRALLVGGTDQGTAQALLGVVQLDPAGPLRARSRPAPESRRLTGLDHTERGRWIRFPRSRLGRALGVRSYAYELQHAPDAELLVVSIEEAPARDGPCTLLWTFDQSRSSVDVVAGDRYQREYLTACRRGVLSCPTGDPLGALASELADLGGQLTVVDDKSGPRPLELPLKLP